MLFVKGFDAGQPIVYLSTDAGQPLTAVLERSTYVPALNNASFNGGDDFLGSARERCSASSTAGPAPTTRKPRDSSPVLRMGTPPRTPAPGHRADQRAAARRRPAERVRRLPDPQTPATPTLTARCGTLSSACGPSRPSRKGQHPPDSTRSRCSTWPPPAPTCSPGSTRPPASPNPTARSASTSTAR